MNYSPFGQLGQMFAQESILDSLLNKYITATVALSQKDISKSKISRDWVLEKIKNKIKEKYAEPQLYSEEPFLNFGSYFCGVQVSEVDEYDILVVIDSNSGFYYVNNTPVAEGLGTASPNNKYNSIYQFSESNYIDPNKILYWLKNIATEVANSYNGEIPTIQSPAVNLVIQSTDINIDLVPAGIFKNNYGNIFYIIPEGNSWIMTNPKNDKQILENIASTRPEFKNIIRLIKHIRNKYKIKISSYAIQCCAISYTEKYTWEKSIFNNFKNVLNYFAGCLERGSILDKYNSDNNLLKNVINLNTHAKKIREIIQDFGLIHNPYIYDNKEYERLSSILNNTATNAFNPYISSAKSAQRFYGGRN